MQFRLDGVCHGARFGTDDEHHCTTNKFIRRRTEQLFIQSLILQTSLSRAMRLASHVVTCGTPARPNSNVSL
jgi:hypothetical protein